MRKQTFVAVGLALLQLALPACAVSESEEKQIGRETARQVESQLPMLNDPAADAFISALGHELVRASGAADGGAEWRFRVVNNRDVNAFAVPGGYVYVHRGLIERAERLDELAGVLGHEIGHVRLRHSAEQMEKARRANGGVAIVCTLTRICESDAARVAINVGGSAYFARHSREDEREADAAGIAIVVRAGIHPEGIPTFFERLMADRRGGGRRLELLNAWFGTHPLEEERVRNARATIAGLDPAGLRRLTRDSEAFQEIKRRLGELP